MSFLLLTEEASFLLLAGRDITLEKYTHKIEKTY